MTRRAGSPTRYAAEFERTVEMSAMHSPTQNLAACPPRTVCLRSSFGSCGCFSTRHGVRSASYAPCAKPTGTLIAHSYSLCQRSFLLRCVCCCAGSLAAGGASFPREVPGLSPTPEGNGLPPSSRFPVASTPRGRGSCARVCRSRCNQSCSKLSGQQ